MAPSKSASPSSCSPLTAWLCVNLVKDVLQLCPRMTPRLVREAHSPCNARRCDRCLPSSKHDLSIMQLWCGGLWHRAKTGHTARAPGRRQNGSDSARPACMRRSRSAAARRPDLILPCLTLQPPNEPRDAKSVAHRSSALTAVLHLVRHGRSRQSLSPDGALLFELPRSNPSWERLCRQRRKVLTEAH